MVDKGEVRKEHKPESYRAINDYVTNILPWKRTVKLRKSCENYLDQSSDSISESGYFAVTPELTPRSKLRNQAKQMSDHRGF